MATLKLELTPIFDEGDAVEGIDVHIAALGNIPTKQGSLIFRHALAMGPTETIRRDSDSLHVTNKHGFLRLDSKDVQRKREFFLPRDIEGDHPLEVSYEARPRAIDEYTRCGPQRALEKGGNGMTGGGLGFILELVPVDEDIMFDVSIEWKLEHRTNVRCVCTLGEGTMVKAKVKPSVLQEVFFAVGTDLHSFPEQTQRGNFGLYWFEHPPFDTTILGKQIVNLSSKMASFFQDPDQNYRIFIRRNNYKCASGTGAYRGFVFAWTPVAFSRDNDSALEFLAHETVHNWPRLQSSGIIQDDYKDGWFNEGIAEYYSVVLPYRFGIYTEEQLVRVLNLHVSGYYTNPDRLVPQKDVFDNFWKPGSHINRVPYQRGLMHFLLMAYKLHENPKPDGRSLDDIIIEMVKRRLDNETHNIATFLDLVETELGQDAREDYRKMSNGELLHLPSDLVDTMLAMNSSDDKERKKHRWAIQRQDQELFSLGFSEACLTEKPRMVKDLVPKSRAATAGVKEGDEITAKYGFLWMAEDWDKDFWMVVKRENEQNGAVEEKKITWWPRAREKVESWQFVSA